MFKDLRDTQTKKMYSMTPTLSSPSQTAGLHPTAEQIEMFAYHLPDATLSNLVVSTTILSLVHLPVLSIKATVCKNDYNCDSIK